jgi:hypothetical protein
VQWPDQEEPSLDDTLDEMNDRLMPWMMRRKTTRMTRKEGGKGAGHEQE